MNCQIVTIEWLMDCARGCSRVSEAKYLYRVLTGMRICITGFQQGMFT